MFRKLIFILFLFFAISTFSFSYAWIPNGEICTITQVVSWDGLNHVMFVLSTGYYIYIDNTIVDSKAKIALLYSAFLEKKQIAVHGYQDNPANLGGYYPVYRLHRFIILRD